MTRPQVLSWLASREPVPPAPLASKLAAVVASAPTAIFAGDSVAKVMGGLGAFTLDSQPSALDQALHLLAADAFVTYAFEAASEEGTDVADLARVLVGEVAA
jgi:hypothetical protein